MELEHEVKAAVINHCTSHDPMLGQSVEMLMKTMPFENLPKFVDLLKPILSGYNPERPNMEVKQNTSRPHAADRLFGYGSDIPFRGRRWVPHPYRDNRSARRRFARRVRKAAQEATRANSYHYDREETHDDGNYGRSNCSTPIVYNLRGGSININGDLLLGLQGENHPFNPRSTSSPQQLANNYQCMYERWVRR